MSDDRDLQPTALSRLVDVLEARTALSGLSQDCRLRLAFERLILMDPKGAGDVLRTHFDEVIKSAPDIGNVLGRTFLERKMHGEAADLVLSMPHNLIGDTTICIRLAKC